ncbi:MAG: type I CRISPR-associated protein Cas7 [Clostridia bacterium]|nr:type I CRISPR-associated protein Cas7 [Clostridia bacterium]
MEEMRNRVYGVVGIKSVMANWNANFSGRPRVTSNNEIFGSDKAFKYPIKKMWEANGEKVLYVKSYKKEKSNIQPKDLNERYEQIFGEDVNNIKDKEKVLKHLFSAIDVMNFGATFAAKDNNIGITGAVQVGQGFNKYEDSNVEVIEILSPFRNSNNENNTNSSIGTKIVSDEAHYFYPFSVNPKNYDVYHEVVSDFTGYTKEAYKKFKEACLVAATAFNTNSKSGCENEFALFVECKEESKLYLANLDQYITFKKVKDGKDIIDFSKLTSILEDAKGEIDHIELYYNDYSIELVGINDSYKINKLF